MELSFTKMNGAGNDFVLLDNRSGALQLSREQIARICDRHRGVGADGLLLVESPANASDFRMRYYNSDGGEAEMCGNGARCFTRFALSLQADADSATSFETEAGVIQARLIGAQVELEMSEPHSLAAATELEVNGRSLTVHFINTGVPHAVVFVDDLEAVDIKKDGAAIRYHGHFAPKGTNANFVQVLAPGQIRIRTYERGVEDETLACGTGVVACSLIHYLRDGAASPISVQVRGGDTLQVGFQASSGKFQHVTLLGPADFTFQGTIRVE
ncbi:MAG TPA: diaminopimelate epimerase [Chthoniobacterales bacterium]